ncbi:MAG TPA: hypothetical protein VEB19_05535, partial [Gemmatimonadaceae bacterium]|nr:hypothetical protein [Gemmatimonadaceae bacterium]
MTRFFLPLFILAALTAPGRDVHAQEMELPVAVQVPLFRKVLSFDRRLDVKSRAELVIAVIYQSGNRESSAVKDDV